MNQFIEGVKCLLCGREYGVLEARFACSDCGDQGTLEVIYDVPAIRRSWRVETLSTNIDYSMWRYLPLSPILPGVETPPTQVGWTPLYESIRLADRFEIKGFYLKDETRNPSGISTDRAAALATVLARELKSKGLCAVAGGRESEALARFCAETGLPGTIFAPAETPKNELDLIENYGLEVVKVDGDIYKARELCRAAAEKNNWFYRTAGVNPFEGEGLKTCAMEICEQLHWRVPEKVFVGASEGSQLAGLYKGFKDLNDIGFTAKMPQLFGVQIEDEDTRLMEKFAAPEGEENKQPELAPLDEAKALRAVRETKGGIMTVTKEELKTAQEMLARRFGKLVEPTGAAALAGVLKMGEEKKYRKYDRVVAVTSHPLGIMG